MSNNFIAPQDGPQLAVQQVAQAPSALANTDQARAVAETQAALVIAQSRPRNEIVARDNLIKACQRASLAASAIYTYPRGGQSVSGPSIRLAEVAARCWGNMNYGFRELSRADGESEVEAYAWDLETNTKVVRQFSVRHIRDTRNGGTKLTAERDIYELVANQSQRRVRACILEVVPGDFIEDAVKQCEQTSKAALTDGKDMKTVITDMAEAFAKFGVPREAIEKRLGHRLDPTSTQPAEILNLKKVWTSINDGFSTAGDWFDLGEAQKPAPSTEADDEVEASLKKTKAASAASTPATVECPNTKSTVRPDVECKDCKSKSGCPALEG